MLINIENEKSKMNLSNNELANKLNVSRKKLKKWIRCQEAIPASKLTKLSLIFGGCSVDYLLIRN